MASDEDTLRRMFDEQQPATMRAGDVEAPIGLRVVPDPVWCPQAVADVCGLEAIRTAVGALFTGAQAPGNTLRAANEAV
jgi:hypothetical protein